MNVNFFGHNCFLLQGKKILIVTDPWLTDEGAFFGSWFQWPVNHHLKSKLIESLNTNIKTCLYISHEHQDHFDRATLREIQPYIELCIIPSYDDKYLYNEMLDLGYEITELSNESRYYLNEVDYLELMIVDTGVNHDSTAIIHIDKKTFVNQNDCKIFDRLSYLEDMEIDFYAVQFSGASWHPVCFDLSEVEKANISKKKALSKLVAVRNAIKQIKPKYYIPSAGPAVFPFLETSLSLGFGNIFLHQADMKKFLNSSNTQILFLKPGDQINDLNITEPIAPPKATDLHQMKKEFFCHFENVQDDDFCVNKLLGEVNKRIAQIRDLKFSECPKILFDWQENGLEIDLNKASVRLINFASYKMPASYEKITASKAYFSLMSDPKNRWQDIALSLRASVRRKPDVLNTFVNIFLFSNDSNIRSGFTTTLDINDERMVVVNPLNGKNYEINRYCPHNGADLKNAKIDKNGNVVCPRHAWLFDLENRGKCTSADASLDAKEIVDTISLCDTVSARLFNQSE